MSPVLAAALFVQAQGDAILLRFQPPVGTRVSYVLTNSIVQTIPGLEEPVVSKTTIPMTLRVVSRENGLTTIESRTGKVKVTLPPNSPVASMKERLEKMGGDMTSTVTMDDKGAVKGTKLGATGPDAGFVRQIGGGVMEGIQRMSLPQTPLRVGDAYTVTFDLGRMLTTTSGALKLQGEGKFPITCRLVSVEAGLAKLSMTMKGTATATDGKTTLKIAMSMTGEQTVEVATGLVRSSSTTGDSDMTIAGQTMRQHIVSTMKSL